MADNTKIRFLGMGSNNDHERLKNGARKCSKWCFWLPKYTQQMFMMKNISANVGQEKYRPWKIDICIGSHNGKSL